MVDTQGSVPPTLSEASRQRIASVGAASHPEGRYASARLADATTVGATRQKRLTIRISMDPLEEGRLR